MYQNYSRGVTYQKGDRYVAFAGPFLLGALTGGVAVGAFTGRPNYGYRPNYGQPYYPYYPYYRF